MSVSDKSIHGPPEETNNRSVASAAVVRSGFEAGCEKSGQHESGESGSQFADAGH